MAWVRIDDQAPRNSKMLKAGPAACWLWVCGIAHCQSQLTDGFISMEVLPMIGVAGSARCRKLADSLVEARLFDRAEGGYAVHGYLDMNPSRVTVLQKRAEDAERKRKGEDRRAEDARTPNGIRPESGAPRAGVPSHPILSHPKESTRALAPPEDAAAVFDLYRELWATCYGYPSSLILRPLETMRLQQHIADHGLPRIMAALRAYFAAEDGYIRKAKHPLPLFLNDPLKYLAKDAVQIGRPRGCRHEPACADDAAHTKRDLADRRQAS